MTEKPAAPKTTPDRAQLAKFAKTIKLQEHVVLLDRDGTLNVDRADYVKSPAEVTLLPGVPEAIARLTQAGWRVLVLTNQACVAKGIITGVQLEEIHRVISDRIAQKGGKIDRWYICPHQDGDGCDCRKPLPGLVNQARRDWRFEPSRTYVVGDAARDMAMARAGGCQGALVLTGKGEQEAAQVPGVPQYRDLTAFVDALLSGSLGAISAR
jgi:D-glycero-D-manno-heptose 1,7-bisphosphate phosphatase